MSVFVPQSWTQYDYDAGLHIAFTVVLDTVCFWYSLGQCVIHSWTQCNHNKALDTIWSLASLRQSHSLVMAQSWTVCSLSLGHNLTMIQFWTQRLGRSLIALQYVFNTVLSWYTLGHNLVIGSLEHSLVVILSWIQFGRNTVLNSQTQSLAVKSLRYSFVTVFCWTQFDRCSLGHNFIMI